MDKEPERGQKRDRRSADSGLGAEEESPARRVRQRPSEGVVVPPALHEEPEPPQEQESADDRIARLISTYRVQEHYGSDDEEDREGVEQRHSPRVRPPRVQADPRQALLDPEELKEKLEALEIPEGQEAAGGQGVADVTFASAESSSSEVSVVGGMAFVMADFMAGIGGAIADAAREGARAVVAAQGAPPQHAGGAQLNALPIFSDDKSLGSLSAKEWIRRVERMGQNFGWNNALLAGSAKNKLSGSAATWLEGQLVRGQIMDDWNGDNGFRNQFLQRFDKARGALAAVEAISDLQQKGSQSVRGFYDEVSIAVDLKHYNITDADKQEPNYQLMRDNDIYILFQAGLNRKIKELAMAGADPPDNAQNLLDAAVRIEVTLQDNNKSQHKVGEVQHDTAGSSDEDDANRSPEEQIAALKQQIKGLKAKDTAKLKCFEKDCQSTEHLVANCPIRKAKIRARERGGGGGRGRGGRGRGTGGGWGWGGNWNWGSYAPYSQQNYGYRGPPRRARGRWPRSPMGRGSGGRGRGGHNYAYEIQEYDYENGGTEGYEGIPEEAAPGMNYEEQERGYYDETQGWYSGND